VILRPVALRSALGLLLVASIATPALGITDEEIFRDFRFNFANPGARALAMGGAFIAIANDSTAAQANPARLGVLRRPEIFAEVRSRNVDASGRDTGTFFIDQKVNPASTLNLTAAVEPETQTTPSVVSFVYPFTLRRSLTVGFSRQELLSVKSAATNDFDTVPLDTSPFQDPANPENVTSTSVGNIDASLVLYNLSAGYQLTRDLFVGGSVVFGQLDLKADIDSQLSDPDGVFSGLGGIDPRFQQFPPRQSLLATSIDDSGSDVAWSIGLFWKLNEYVQFGTVYKKGVNFDVDESVRVPSSAVSIVGRTTGTIQTSFNVPDISGFGVAYRPFARSQSAHLPNLLFAMDVVRVENHDLVDGFVPQLNVLTLPGRIQSIEFTADNQTEIHVGAEYFMFFGNTALGVRLGAFTDPDNSVHVQKVTSNGTAEQNGTKTAIEKGDLFPTRDSVTHVTGGLSLTVSDFEFAIAYDTSDIETQSLFSVIYRFPR